MSTAPALTPMQTRIGKPAPLGSSLTDEGANFAVWAPDATAVELSLFENRSPEERESRYPMYRGTDGVWHLEVVGCGPGQTYGYRADGPWVPPAGQLFNPAKLLLDPRSLAVSGELRWDPALVTACDKSDGVGGGPCPVDSAPYTPRSLVVDSWFDWQGDARPKIPWSDTVLYECHLRGLTVQHPEVPEADRGRFAGLAHAPVVDHLKSLGVTTVELLPVQQFLSERHLQQRGLVNYWGYNPVATMAPHGAYASRDDGAQVTEFREMVRRLHSQGLEVVLDIVFNHSAEGDLGGPTVSLRGLANPHYYRRYGDGAYEDFSGCGNSLDLRREPVRRLVIDSLRYWVTEMRVDGFRLDLATVLGRDSPDFDATAPFFRELAADPQLQAVKWIAEPWDAGPDGYRLGDFPPPFAEWNDRFRDTSRAAWRGDVTRLTELTRRLAGSPDLFATDRGRQASVNYVTAHDGFTLVDLTSYERRYNQANDEENRDGHPHTLSRNWGVEGPTDEPEVVLLRQRARRNLLATLALAEGVPMLSHGDELDRTQGGNNNPYCQDNPITWVDWSRVAAPDSLLSFVRRAFALRRELRSRPPTADGEATLDWRPLPAQGGAEGSGDRDTSRAGLVLRLAGPPGDDQSPLLLLNCAATPTTLRLPGGRGYRRVALSSFEIEDRVRDEVELPPHSLLLLDPLLP